MARTDAPAMMVWARPAGRPDGLPTSGVFMRRSLS